MTTMHNRQRAIEHYQALAKDAERWAARKLTEADLDAHQANRLPLNACHGPCDQGRRRCPCPQACAHMADDDLRAARGIVGCVMWALAVWAIAASVVAIAVSLIP